MWTLCYHCALYVQKITGMIFYGKTVRLPSPAGGRRNLHCVDNSSLKTLCYLPPYTWLCSAMNDPIETERLILRPFQTQDLDGLALICSDPLVMQYIGGWACTWLWNLSPTLSSDHDPACKIRVWFVGHYSKRNASALRFLWFDWTNRWWSQSYWAGISFRPSVLG